MNKKLKTTPWIASETLDSPSLIATYLEEALAEAKDDPKFLLTALETVAKTRNFSELSREVGLSRAGLYKALSEDGNPSFATVWELLKALGIRMEFHAAS
jgi:probable addiction module antidote protein